METIPKRSERKKEKGRKISLVIFVSIIGIVYAVLITLLPDNEESLKNLGQNFGTLIISIGISFPAIIAAVFPIKYSEADAKRKEDLQRNLFIFAVIYSLFILANTLVFIAFFSSLLPKKQWISIMAGMLIGFTILSIGELKRLLKK